MRIGPSPGSSTFVFVSVSKSRIDPAQSLVARQGRDHGPELRPALLAGESDAQCAQVPADRLELAHEGARVEVAVAAFDELTEALERLARVDLDRRGRRQDCARVFARFV